MEKVIHSCVNAMLEAKVIEKRQEAIMVYGLDLLFSSIFAMCIVIVLGFIMNQGVYTIILLGTFIPLQSFGGGFHCQTHLRCWGMMLAGYMVAILGVIHLPIPLLWCSAILSAYCFMKLAPIENANAPFSWEFGKKMRRIVIIIYFVMITVAAGLTWAKLESVKAVLTAITLSGISIMCAKIRQCMKEKRSI